MEIYREIFSECFSGIQPRSLLNSITYRIKAAQNEANLPAGVCWDGGIGI